MVRSINKNERRKFIYYVRSLLSTTAQMDAEDIVHDVLTNILERTDPPAPELLLAYIFRSLKNRVIDYARTRKTMLSLDTQDIESQGQLVHAMEDRSPSALDLLQSEEGRRELFEALDMLSEIERQVIISHELEGSTFKELAQMWQMPINTLLSHKARAMKKLQAHFQKL